MAGIGGLVWSRSGDGQAALLNLGAEKLYDDVQDRLDAALSDVLPGLAEAAGAEDAHDWPLPAAGPAAAIRCRVVAVDLDATWWELQEQLAGSLETVAGRVLWSERLTVGRNRPELLRLDAGVDGRPTHTLVLYPAGAPRPEVRWGGDPSHGAWRQLCAHNGAPTIALVIDDWGYRNDSITDGLLALDAPLTLSVLPGLAYSRRFALQGTDLALPGQGGGLEPGLADEAARLRLDAGCPVTLGLGAAPQRLEQRRREILLHLPMQPQGYPEVDPGPEAILVGMSRHDMGEHLDKALQALPNIRGVNNHMGSAATADAATMTDLMAELKARDLIFLDSLTTARSVAYETALGAGLPTARNRIFLDHDHQDPERVRQRLEALVRHARAKGFAVGIGHPHESTMSVLRRELPRLQAAGIQFVTLSELLALQGLAANEGI
jgi:polysaccharide deacetylase 2 family uncharacterized protein YibQ